MNSLTQPTPGMHKADNASQPACHFPDELPAYIKPRYARLALIADEADLHRLGPVDEDTLIVCCDWLHWHRLVAAGRHAVYYELGFLDWHESDTLNTDLFVHSNDWILENDEDPSIFHGVSLGLLFGAEMSMVMMNFHRITRALRSLIRRYKPDELVLYNFRYDINYLDGETRRRLIADIADGEGVKFIDHAPADDSATLVAAYRLREAPTLRQYLATAYAAGLDFLSRLRRAFSRTRQRVLVLVNSNVALPLVSAYPGGTTAPIMFARTVPKRWRLVLRCLAKGVLLANPREAKPSPEDMSRIAEIIEDLSNLDIPADNEALAFARNYVKRVLLDPEQMTETAAGVLTAVRLLERYKPSRIVLDGVRSRRHLSYIQYAHRQGIAIDYIWHSPATPQNLKFGALGGDPRQKPLVDRVLTWGPTNEAWLPRVGATQPFERVGSPIRDKYVTSASARGIPSKPAAETKVLVLQYGPGVHDLVGMNANMYGAFVNTVRELRNLGYRDVTLKMHPGPGRWAQSYFEEISRHFGLDCNVAMREPFQDWLAWADVVIGPTRTGAMFETLAAGKPYIAMLLEPNSIVDRAYFEGFPVISSISELPQALKTYDIEAGRKILNDVYSINDIAKPSQRFWDVLSAS